MVRFRWALMALVGSALLSTPALAVFCDKPSGAVFIRATCKKKETTVNLAALGLQGPPGTPGAPGTPGTPGTPGAPGAAGAAVAYAHVGSNGMLDATNSKNVTATSLYTIPMLFYYCIDVAVPFKNVIVTPDATSPVIAVATIGDPFTSCAPHVAMQATGDVTVQTFNASGAAVGSGFWLLFN